MDSRLFWWAGKRVPEHKNDWIASQEHLGDEAVFVDRFGLEVQDKVVSNIEQELQKYY